MSKHTEPVCSLGMIVSVCRSAQDTVSRLGGTPFYCDDCRFPLEVPRLIELHTRGQDGEVARLLAALGFEDLAESVHGRNPVEVPTLVGWCSYTRQAVMSPCSDESCPMYIRAEWANHCLNHFRTLTGLTGPLTSAQLAAAMATSEAQVDSALEQIRTSAAEAVGEPPEEPAPTWVRELERQFGRPIADVLQDVAPERLAVGYALSREQLGYLCRLHDRGQNTEQGDSP